MTFARIVLLAVIQGLAELLPVSSSAHVIAAAKLMGIDPASPPFTLLLVMLHTGTMFAVIVYFWRSWQRAFFSSAERFRQFAVRIIVATIVTGVIALILKVLIEHVYRHLHPQAAKAQVEDLFRHLELLAAALAAAGALILWSGLRSGRGGSRDSITPGDSLAIGAIQGLSLPFRGFSRSGATISVGLLRGMSRRIVEEYSFALAVVLTPVVVVWEGRRLIQSHGAAPVGMHDFTPSLVGMVFSFLAGLVALRLLSRLLENGRWWVFGVYCFVAAGFVFGLYLRGY